MDRRQALKNLGLGATALLVTPTVMSILQSCSNEPEFIPFFLSMEEGHALRRIVDLIIPNDDAIPGATALGVHEFIDSYWDQVANPKSQAQVRLGFAGLAAQFQNMFSKPLAEGKAEDFDQMCAKYLKVTKEQEKAYGEQMGEFYQKFATDKSATPSPDLASYSILGTIRGMTIWGWKTTEVIGETVLAYDPVPAAQKGCIPVSDTGGKAYSI